MKNLYLIILLLCTNIVCKAQWVGAGNGMDFYVHAMTTWNGNLYASGNFEHADGNECLGIDMWNGSAWSPVGGGMQHGAISFVVAALTVFNGNLIAGGYIDSAGGVAVHKVAQWDGNAWSPLGMNLAMNTVCCFAVHNGDLYAGGSNSVGQSTVSKWDGTTWTAIENTPGNKEVYALASYNGELYAGGGFDSFGGITTNYIAKWNGSAWSDVGGGFINTTMFNSVRALAVYNGKLYVGGNFNSAGTATLNHIASWDGGTWADVGGGVGGSTAGVQCLVPYDNKLFVGGSYWTVNGNPANRAAYWDGSAWTILGADLYKGARTMAVYNGELYSGGEGAGNGQYYVARWTAGTFSGIAEQNNNNLVLYPNPANDITNAAFINNHSSLNNFVVKAYSGREVKKVQHVSNEFTMDISDLHNGIYFLYNETEMTLPQKFIVHH